MPEEDERASEVKHAREVLQIILVTRDQPTIILEPCKQPLNLPSMTVAPQGAAILRQFLAVRAMRRDHLHTGFSQFSIKLVRIVGIVANQALDRFFHEDLCQGLHHQLDFVWRPLSAQTVIGRPRRSATAMILVPLPRLVLPTPRPPF